MREARVPTIALAMLITVVLASPASTALMYVQVERADGSTAPLSSTPILTSPSKTVLTREYFESSTGQRVAVEPYYGIKTNLGGAAFAAQSCEQAPAGQIPWTCADSGECTWSNPSQTWWAPTSPAGRYGENDFAYGRCLVVAYRTWENPNGSRTVEAYWRPAVRITNPQLSTGRDAVEGIWSATATLDWLGGESPLNGEPLAFGTPAEGCIHQQAANNIAFADCVWSPAAIVSHTAYTGDELHNDGFRINVKFTRTVGGQTHDATEIVPAPGCIRCW